MQKHATIQLRVGGLRQLFNAIDPSPLHERDLDPACEEFIVSWAREFPADEALHVEIRVEHEPPPPGLLEQLQPAVRAHFVRAASLQNLRLRRMVREGRLSLAIGLAVLALCISAATLIPAETLGAAGGILTESLIIAGWVVMWHPLEVLLYGLWPVVRERRLLERLAEAEVRSTGPLPAAPGFAGAST
jgi:hypothetical protein